MVFLPSLPRCKPAIFQEPRQTPHLQWKTCPNPCAFPVTPWSYLITIASNKSPPDAPYRLIHRKIKGRGAFETQVESMTQSIDETLRCDSSLRSSHPRSQVWLVSLAVVFLFSELRLRATLACPETHSFVESGIGLHLSWHSRKIKERLPVATRDSMELQKMTWFSSFTGSIF